MSGKTATETRSERVSLIIEASARDSDLLYASRFLATDPIIYVQRDGQSCLILSDLECGRGRKEAKVDRIVSYSDLERELQREYGIKSPGIEDVVVRFLRNEGIKELLVSKPGECGANTRSSPVYALPDTWCDMCA